MRQWDEADFNTCSEKKEKQKMKNETAEETGEGDEEDEGADGLRQ